MGLTLTQSELLTFIQDYLATHGGVAPKYDEMKDFMGLRSKSGITRILHQLEERGHIRRLFNRARAIEIVSGVPFQ